MVNLLRRLADDVAAGVAVASATVVDTSRSVPRHAGARMLVYRDGRCEGTVGGGEMENRVVAEARLALDDGRCRLLSYFLVDPGRGDPGVCGGDVRIFVEPHMPQPTLVVMGYGHVGRAVVQVASWLGYRTVAVDDRQDVAETPATPQGETVEDPTIGDEGPDELIIGGVDNLTARFPMDADTSVVCVTRNVDVDCSALPGLLASGASYVGVMGSKRRWKTTRARLADMGVAEADLDRVHAPIGVEIGAETPEEIAVSIMAQVVAHRRM